MRAMKIFLRQPSRQHVGSEDPQASGTGRFPGNENPWVCLEHAVGRTSREK